MTPKQRDTFRRLAEHARDHSPDPSTQNAACFPRLNVYAANRPVFNTPLTEAELSRFVTDRDWKLGVIEHAERNAIYDAGGNHTDELHALWLACPDCARAIVSNMGGSRRVYSLELPTPERWRTLVELGDWILQRGGIEHVRFPVPGVGVTIRFNGAPLEL